MKTIVVFFLLFASSASFVARKAGAATLPQKVRFNEEVCPILATCF